MKKLLLLLILCSCATTQRVKPVKPYVVEREPRYVIGIDRWKYEFIDATGIPFISYEKYGFYHKGDTVK